MLSKKPKYMITNSKLPISYVTIKYVVTGDLLIAAYWNLVYELNCKFEHKGLSDEIYNILDLYGYQWGNHIEVPYKIGWDIIVKLKELGYEEYFKHEKYDKRKWFEGDVEELALIDEEIEDVGFDLVRNNFIGNGKVEQI